MAEYDGRNQRKWHMSRDVSLSDMLGLVAALAAVGASWATINTRLSLIEQAQAALKADAEQTTKRLEVSIGEINRKLDRLIERR